MPDLYVMFSHTNTGMGRMIRAVTGSSYNHVSISLRPDLALSLIHISEPTRPY